MNKKVTYLLWALVIVAGLVVLAVVSGKINCPLLNGGAADSVSRDSEPFVAMQEWRWVNTLYADGATVEADNPDDFVLVFDGAGHFTLTTDCNGVGGDYTVADDGYISFTNMIMTEMYCEGSQERDIIQVLEGASMYHFTDAGELVLDLKYDSGTATFR